MDNCDWCKDCGNGCWACSVSEPPRSIVLNGQAKEVEYCGVIHAANPAYHLNLLPTLNKWGPVQKDETLKKGVYFVAATGSWYDYYNGKHFMGWHMSGGNRISISQWNKLVK